MQSILITMPAYLSTAALFAGILATTPATAQQPQPAQEAFDASENDLDHAVKVSDDVLRKLELGDIAEVRTFRYTGFAARGQVPEPDDPLCI